MHPNDPYYSIDQYFYLLRITYYSRDTGKLIH